MLPVDEREEVKLAQLGGALEDGAQRRARRLLDVVEEDDRTLWQRRLHELCRVGAGGVSPRASKPTATTTAAAAAAPAAPLLPAGLS